MADKKERMQVSWRLDYLSDNERKKINAWLDQQANNQKSITNVVLHAIDRFGNADIMDHDIQKLLFRETLQPQENSPVKVKMDKEDKTTATNPSEDKDDWFEGIDENNL